GLIVTRQFGASRSPPRRAGGGRNSGPHRAQESTLMAHFVPPVPPTPPRPVGFRDFLRATRTNAIGIFSELSYTEWSVTGRQASRTTVVLNAPDAIHHVLVANPENYRRTPTSVRILYPIVGD